MRAQAGFVARRRLSKPPGVTGAAAMQALPDDSALMLRYGDGDARAFETLYRRHKDAMYRYLVRLSRHPDTAEDIFQEVWGKVIRARKTYRPTAKFTTFLYCIAHNCFIDHMRRNRRHAKGIAVDIDAIPDTSDTPDVLAERALARRRLDKALHVLPDEQRDVFLLHEEAGLGLDDIAMVTGCNRETAKSRLRYAFRKLRTAIDGPTGVP